MSGGLYPPPPYLYRGATAIIASYEADPAAITGLLPPGVTPLEDPPVCLAWVVHYPFSTLGVYNEAVRLAGMTISRFWILPVGPLGSASRIHTWRGYL